MMIVKRVLFSFVVLWSLNAVAADRSAVKQKAMMCNSCHGRDGVSSISRYPSLKGQNEEDLISALKDYREGKRKGPMAAMMEAQSRRLSDDDIHALAAYYANLK